MPTWAMLLKGLVEGGIVGCFGTVVVIVAFKSGAKFLERMLETFAAELRAERKDHNAEVELLMTKYDTLHEDHLEFRRDLAARKLR